MGAGWCASSGGAVGAFFGLFVIATIAAIFVRKSVWTMIGLLGLVSGYFTGAFFFTILASASGWEDEWGYWTLVTFFAIVGCLFAYHYGVPVVMTLTSLVGSYLFMRAWTLFFPGYYPSESQIVSPVKHADGDAFEMTGWFWLFIGIFCVTFAFCMTF